MWPFSRKPIVKPINETSLVPLSNGVRSFIDAINKSKQKIAEFNRLKEKVEMDITHNEKDLDRLRMILNEIIALLSDTLDKRLDAKLENIEELVDDVQRSIEAIRKYKGKPKMKAA